MRCSTFSAAAAIVGVAIAQSTALPGYLSGYSTITDADFSFGKHYAVLTLDVINGLVGEVNSTTEGQTWIESLTAWNDAVHKKSPRPMDIFTRIYFSTADRPEIKPGSPFATAVARLGNATASSPQSQIYPAFKTDDRDVILQKFRYEADIGNPLKEILRAQQIDTVVLSGIRTSGVILSTTYSLLDNDYKVFVIGDNVIESPGMDAPATDAAIKKGIIPKLPANIITLEQALAALEKSG